MSAITEKFLMCDGGCGEPFGVDSMRHGFTHQEIRVAAKQNGWTFSQGKDYCPECSIRHKPVTEVEKGKINTEK